MAKRAFRTPEVLTPDEQRALLGQPDRRYPTDQRNHLLLHLILDTGLRLAEAMPCTGETSTSIPASRWSDKARKQSAQRSVEQTE